MKSHALKRIVALAVAAAAIGAGAFALLKPSPSTAHRSGPASFAELIAMSDAELAKLDVARMNLLCADGLPGAEGLEFRSLAIGRGEIVVCYPGVYACGNVSCTLLHEIGHVLGRPFHSGPVNDNRPDSLANCCFQHIR